MELRLPITRDKLNVTWNTLNSVYGEFGLAMKDRSGKVYGPDGYGIVLSTTGSRLNWYGIEREGLPRELFEGALWVLEQIQTNPELITYFFKADIRFTEVVLHLWEEDVRAQLMKR